MSRKVLVANLSLDTTDDTLRKIFARFGPVTQANVILERGTNLSRGFGFVIFADPSAAEKAVTHLDGTKVGGCLLRVKVDTSAENLHSPGPRVGSDRHRSFGDSRKWLMKKPITFGDQ